MGSAASLGSGVWVTPSLSSAPTKRRRMAGFMRFMDWFKGKSTENHGFYHQIYGFPVNCPIIQFYEVYNWENHL